MIEAVHLEVAGRRVEVAPPPDGRDFVRAYLGPFAAPPGPAEGRLVLHWDDEVPPPPGAYELSAQDGTAVGWGLPRGTVVEMGMRVPGSIGRAISIALSALFRAPRYTLVHGAGLRLGGKALVVLGQSGAGKSTLSMLFEEADLLSDELLVVENGAEPAVHATPVRSSATRPISTGSATIRSLLALEKSAEVKLAPLPSGDAMRLVLEQSLTHDASVTDHFEIASSLVSRLPRHTLHFRKDRSCVPLLMNLLA